MPRPRLYAFRIVSTNHLMIATCQTARTATSTSPRPSTTCRGTTNVIAIIYPLATLPIANKLLSKCASTSSTHKSLTLVSFLHSELIFNGVSRRRSLLRYLRFLHALYNMPSRRLFRLRFPIFHLLGLHLFLHGHDQMRRPRNLNLMHPSALTGSRPGNRARILTLKAAIQTVLGTSRTATTIRSPQSLDRSRSDRGGERRLRRNSDTLLYHW